jgi:hypothetical protein
MPEQFGHNFLHNLFKPCIKACWSVIHRRSVCPTARRPGSEPDATVGGSLGLTFSYNVTIGIPSIYLDRTQPEEIFSKKVHETIEEAHE